MTEAGAVRGSIGLTGPYAAVDPLLSGRENLVMMGRLHHLTTAEAARRPDELLARCDLLSAAGRRAQAYSGGTRRRLDLSASLIGSPPVIFLDEPTTGLDPRSRATMWDAIRRLLSQGVTMLLTTQYLEEADGASGLSLFLVFVPYASSALVPPDTRPGVLRAVVDNQPFTPLINAVRTLPLDQPVDDSG